MKTSRPPLNTFERQIWIAAMLRIKKSSYAAIAREIGVTRQSVRIAAEKPKSKRIEKEIAAKIGYVPELIWPERYQAR